MEVLSTLMARDSLVLTTIRVVHPISAISHWQDAINPLKAIGGQGLHLDWSRRRPYTPPVAPWAARINQETPCLPLPSQQGQFRQRRMRHETA